MFLHDKPESEDIRFGHGVVSDWLAGEIKKAKLPIRLAVTGGLGTGKSTILKSALDRLKKEDRNINTSYVDVWKLDKESVRRSAVLKIAKDLRPNDYKSIEAIKESVYGTRVENSKPKLFNTYWSIPGIVFSIFVGGVIFFILKQSLDLLVVGSANSNAELVKYTISSVGALLGVFFKLLDKSIINIQKTISKSPMVGAEEFEECLYAILDSSKIKDKKTIIVFDNIDRASPSSSRAILSGISAFFDSSEKILNVMIIVPFDPGCLRDDAKGERPLLDDCEKMFDAIIPLPKLTSEDLSDFAFDLLKNSLNDFSYKEEQLRDLAYLVSFSPYRSPREIKHMVNQLMSRLNLAKSLETKGDTRLQVGSTLLPDGSITLHPDCLLKLLICEKINPGFTETLVVNGLDVGKSFEADMNSQLIKEIRDIDPAAAKNLVEFLQATMGIPKNPPQSATAFLYMKGPDQVLAIPSGQAISDAIYHGDGEKLRNVILPKGADAVSHEDIASVIRYHRKKYTKNNQALKNCVRAITIGMQNVTKFEKSLSIEFCEVINSVPDTLKDISPAWLDAISNEYLEVSSINRVWKTIDSDFKSLISSEDEIKKESTVKWLSECFVAVYKQDGGLARINSNDLKIPLVVLLEENIINVIGDNYPATFSTDRDALLAVKNIISGENTYKNNAYDKFLRNRFSGCEFSQDLSAQYSEIVESWKTAISTWLNAKEQDAIEIIFADIIYYWPVKNQESAQYFEKIKAFVSGSQSVFNQKSSSGFSSEIIDICVAIYANGGGSDGNINVIIHHALSVINSDGLDQLMDSYGDTSVVWNALISNANQQLIQSVDRNLYFYKAINNNPSMAKNISSVYASLNSKDSFLDALIKNDVISDISGDIVGYFKDTNMHSRSKLIKVLFKYQVDGASVKQAIEHFILTPDESNKELIVEAESFPNHIKKGCTEFIMSSLISNSAAWDNKEVNMLAWVHLAADEILDANLKDFIDRVIDRGSQNGVNDQIKQDCTDHVLKLWERGHGFSEKSFKILKKSAQSSFSSRIDALARKNNVKESIFEKAGSVIEKALGTEDK